ncbi:Rv0361 family membrane protein [Modestobacter versicolor]|uniref:Rv0361 family membrane protein n=1 Tax=Modestobacter versicolor TaxID=429133 RepID=UPI0034DEF3E7
MSAPQGPFLYDDDPMPLHTGEARNRNGTLIALLSATVLVAVLMVGGMVLFKGSAGDQAEEVAGVFTAALAADDIETAYGLICDTERARITPDELADEYLLPGTPEVTGSRGERVDGEPVRHVQVRWEGAGGTRTSELTVVPEGGTKVCGTAAEG